MDDLVVKGRLFEYKPPMLLLAAYYMAQRNMPQEQQLSNSIELKGVSVHEPEVLSDTVEFFVETGGPTAKVVVVKIIEFLEDLATAPAARAPENVVPLSGIAPRSRSSAGDAIFRDTAWHVFEIVGRGGSWIEVADWLNSQGVEPAHKARWDKNIAASFYCNAFRDPDRAKLVGMPTRTIAEVREAYQSMQTNVAAE